MINNFFIRIWYKWKHWRYERKCLKYFGAKPEKIYLSACDYDALVKRLEEPPSAEQLESLRKLFKRHAPWDDKD